MVQWASAAVDHQRCCSMHNCRASASILGPGVCACPRLYGAYLQQTYEGKGWVDRWLDGWTGGQKEGREGGREEGRKGGREERRKEGRKGGKKEGRDICVDKWMDGWMDKWKEGKEGENRALRIH